MEVLIGPAYFEFIKKFRTHASSENAPAPRTARSGDGFGSLPSSVKISHHGGH
jgi:hypothetical protein